MVATLVPFAGYSQTLDEAVNNQLAPLFLSPCFVLLDSATVIPKDVLSEPLLSICDRLVTKPGGGPSSSTGGGAGTPTTLPSIVQKRLRELAGEEIEIETGAASADAVAELESGLGVFVSGEFESLDRDVTTFEDGFDSDIWRVTAGADYRFTDRIVAGLAVDYAHHDGDFDGGGRFDNNSYGVLAFGSFLPNDRVFVQLSAGYARKTYDRDRFGTFTETKANDTLNFQSEPGPQNADYNADADFTGDGRVASPDFLTLSQGFEKPPGPSGLYCAGKAVGCPALCAP